MTTHYEYVFWLAPLRIFPAYGGSDGAMSILYQEPRVKLLYARVKRASGSASIGNGYKITLCDALAHVARSAVADVAIVFHN